MTENWRPVVGWEGLYQVSDHGRVRSADRVTRCGHGGVRRIKGRILKAFPIQSGHLRVDLSRRGQRSPRAVHRLVLEAFVGSCPDGSEALHWDDNPANNQLSNLRYGTRSENICDAFRNGGRALKTRCVHGHAYTAANTFINSIGYRECRTCRKSRAYEPRPA